MAQLHNARRNACIVEADESMRIRMEGSPHKNQEDHIAGKGMNSLSHYNLVHKCIPVPKALRTCRMRRMQWKKNLKIREDTGMAADESQKQK